MPMHMEDKDVVSQLDGIGSALIVPCRMCPAVTIAERMKMPFMQFFRSLLKSQPFEQYLKKLQERLKEQGIMSDIFGCTLYHQWFMCMWTWGIRRKLAKTARKYEAVIVMGCNSATETVRDAVEPVGCRIVEAMVPVGIMNAKLRFQFPGNITFEGGKIAPLEHQKN